MTAETQNMTEAHARQLLSQLTGVAVVEGGPVITLEMTTEYFAAVAAYVRDVIGCRFFAFLTAIDHTDAGLEVVARLDNLEANVSVMLRTKLGVGNTHCPSLFAIYRGANWMEREAFDMFGIVFDGHPELRRMLLPEDWVGHPLLKSYAVDTPYPPYR